MTLNPSELKTISDKWFASPGLIAIDQAEVYQVVGNAGSGAVFSVTASGTDKAERAITALTSDSAFRNLIKSAKNVIVNVEGPDDLGLSEFTEIINGIAEAANPQVHILCGISIDESLADDIRVTTLVMD